MRGFLPLVRQLWNVPLSRTVFLLGDGVRLRRVWK